MKTPEEILTGWEKENNPFFPKSMRLSRENMIDFAKVYAAAVVEEKEAEIKQLREVLEEISKGEGRYSMDKLEHASNTIEDMKELAINALKIERVKG